MLPSLAGARMPFQWAETPFRKSRTKCSKDKHIHSVSVKMKEAAVSTTSLDP